MKFTMVILSLLLSVSGAKPASATQTVNVPKYYACAMRGSPLVALKKNLGKQEKCLTNFKKYSIIYLQQRKIKFLESPKISCKNV